MKYFILRSTAIGCVAGMVMSTTGCQHKVQYGDPTAIQTLSTDFSSTDLQQIAAAMVDSLLSFPYVVEKTAASRPVLSVDKVKNKSMQHIDTESITDTIRTKLLHSGKFRFVDRTTDEAVIEELSVQRDSGLVDPNKAVPFGQQHGADYLLTANISEIEQSAGRQKDVYYKFTMSLRDVRTGLSEWSDEKEIRKTRTRALMGK